MNSTSIASDAIKIGYCENNPALSHISTASGGIAFLLSLISQFPQLIETYNDKSVEGISPFLLGSWLLGDITSLLGAIMTNQLPFQILLALYFLSNDLIICGQYYYYGILYENKLATAGHQHLIHVTKTYSHPQEREENGDDDVISAKSINNNKSFLKKTALLVLGLFARSSNALPVLSEIETFQDYHVRGYTVSFFQIGLTLSWFSGMFYFCSRIPQLIKFYQRKSTDGLSPYMFYCTIFHNILYAVSIFSSCEFLDNTEKLAFFHKELPFLLGSIGTLLWDFIYLYQHFVLYSEDKKIREELSKLNIVDEDIEVAMETEPLLVTSSHHSSKGNIYASV